MIWVPFYKSSFDANRMWLEAKCDFLLCSTITTLASRGQRSEVRVSFFLFIFRLLRTAVAAEGFQVFWCFFSSQSNEILKVTWPWIGCCSPCWSGLAVIRSTSVSCIKKHLEFYDSFNTRTSAEYLIPTTWLNYCSSTIVMNVSRLSFLLLKNLKDQSSVFWAPLQRTVYSW